MTCLLASCRLSDETNHDRFRQILKGLFGFQLYASEFWTEYVLCVAESKHGMDTDSHLYAVLNDLTQRLEDVHRMPGNQPNVPDAELEKRLSRLQQHSIIHKHVKMALWARSLDQLEEQVKLEHSKDLFPRPSYFETKQKGLY